MIARRNRDVDFLNHQARELRREEGALGEDEVIVGECAFAAGDRVQTRINMAGVCNRERWDVVDADAAARTLTLRRVGGDEREVTLGPRYLNANRLSDDGPSLEHAYAITKFGAQGKTVDRAYPLLDSGASLEQELVALSRGREVANAYVVAASESLDPELGPGRRELNDTLLDIRESVEGQGNDHIAGEVRARKALLELSPAGLAEQLLAIEEEDRKGNPRLMRREELERSVRSGREWVERLGREREAIEAMADPPAEELARVSAGEVGCAKRLRRELAELDALPEPAPEGGKARASRRPVEKTLIEERMATLARRDVRAGREDESKVIFTVLGPYPRDDADKVIWDEGAHALTLYRRRRGIGDNEPGLGKQPKGPAARAERARARLRVEKAQRQLGLTGERVTERGLDHEPTIGR